MKKYVFIIVIVIIICYLVIGIRYSKNKWKEHYEQFESSNIKGEIVKIEPAYKGIQFKMDDDNIEYVFYPSNDFRENKNFEDIAKRGDSIIKPSNSDTLKLIKKDKVYMFSFEKYKYDKDK